ncbi:MAG: helix-turn-helix domain-containing protein [Bacteriovoracia bacterium]
MRNQEMGHFNYKAVMNFLREVLRDRKISYLQLSDLIQVPESTLKKWFISEDGTFNRVNIICNALGITLNDVLIALDQRTVVTFSISKKAQDYFMKDRMTFAVYWLLVYERFGQKEIMEFLQLPEKNLKKILLKLDHLNLITLEAGDKVKIPKVTPVRWSQDGEFMQMIFKEWSHEVLSECLTGRPKTHLFLQYFQLTKESTEEFKRDINLLEEKYARRTVQEMNVQKGRLKKVRFVLGAAEGPFTLI